MRRDRVLPLHQRGLQPIDPVFYYAFPAYYAAMAVYGFTLTRNYLPSFVAVTGPLYAMLFGWLVLTLTGLLVAACWWLSLHRENPKLEAYLTVLLLALLTTHAVYIVLATMFGFTTFEGLHPRDELPPPLPQTYSVAVPVVFAVFPFFRLLVILRSHRLRRRGWF